MVVYQLYMKLNIRRQGRNMLARTSFQPDHLTLRTSLFCIYVPLQKSTRILHMSRIM